MMLLCALAIRVAIPTGYMPTQGADGILVSLCTEQGIVQAVLPIGKSGQPAQDDGDHGKAKDGACTFAAGLGGALLAATVSGIAPAPMAFAPQRADNAIADLTVHRLAAPPPPAQAPPARV